METELYFEEPFSHNENKDQSFLQKKTSSSVPERVSDNCSRSFDCNICLDYARDPVVTLCGHLYCWPCIFKWLSQSPSTTLDQHNPPLQQCPVCKADISDTTLVPLYGRGDFGEDRNDSSEINIPSRPPAYGLNAMISSSSSSSSNQQLHSRGNGVQNQQYYAPSSASSSAVLTHPMMSMFGEMVYTRVFGNSAEVNLIGYPNSYHRLTGSSPSLRRREMKIEKSLNRVSIFLFCCILFCLLLF